MTGLPSQAQINLEHPAREDVLKCNRIDKPVSCINPVFGQQLFEAADYDRFHAGSYDGYYPTGLGDRRMQSGQCQNRVGIGPVSNNLDTANSLNPYSRSAITAQDEVLHFHQQQSKYLASHDCTVNMIPDMLPQYHYSQDCQPIDVVRTQQLQMNVPTAHHSFATPNSYPWNACIPINSPINRNVLNVDARQLIPYQMTPVASSLHSLLPIQSRKRKHEDSPSGSINRRIADTKERIQVHRNQEQISPDIIYGNPGEDFGDYDLNDDGAALADSPYQRIGFSAHREDEWVRLANETGNEISPPLKMCVAADKGFNFSHFDDAFVCQKKNHFQVTAQTFIGQCPSFVKTSDGQVQPIIGFNLDFQGIKQEIPTQVIKIDQSQPDRSKQSFHPVGVDIHSNIVSKLTIGRLHFSETTLNNMRKKGKPNPDQRYLQLVVLLYARTARQEYLVTAQQSDKIIVRASNPGQFEGDSEALWSRSRMAEVVYHMGNVGINSETPEEALTVHGNIKCIGHILSPSDTRVKQNIGEIDTSEQLKNIRQLRLYQYAYCNEFADYAGLSADTRQDTGVLAQEVMKVIPDAVKQTGDVVLPTGEVIENFLVVNKDRIYMESIGAVRELSKVTSNLECRVNEIELINRKLRILKKTCKENLESGANDPDVIKFSPSDGSLLTFNSVSIVESRQSPGDVKCPPDKNLLNVNPSLKSPYDPLHRGSHGSSSSLRAHSCSTSFTDTVVPLEKGWCGNHVIQISMVVLLAIMALCLITIVTLFIWDNANTPSLINNMSTVESTTVNSDWTNDILPPTLAQVSNLQTYFSNKDLIPPFCLVQPERCPVRCCVRGNLNQVLQDGIADGLLYRNVSSPILLNNNSSVDDNVTTDGLANGVKRPPVISVYIMQLNQSIGSEYCTTQECRANIGHSFAYRVPISPMFPLTFITVQFILNSSNATVNLCQQSLDLYCGLSSNDDDIVITNATQGVDSRLEYDLPVGFYFSTSFVFQIGTSVKCRAKEDIHDVHEYSFEFYRTCTT